MTTNFFQSIYDMQVAGDWKLTITHEDAGRLIVSVHFYNEQAGDDARKLIPPLLLKGTPAEIDAGFFEAITAPVQETAQLLVNMAQYHQQQEQARRQSQMEKDKAEKAEKERRERQKRVDEAMKKVDELEAAGKYRDAWLKVPDPADHPEQAEALSKRKTELAKQFAPDLFHVEPQND